MKRKKHFNISMYFLSAALAIFFGFEIYDLFTVDPGNIDYYKILTALRYSMFIIILGLFVKFMNIANKNELFSKNASKVWSYKASVFVGAGILSFIELRFNNGESIEFASIIFLGSFCIAMSSIFKQATVIKQENDLTI